MKSGVTSWTVMVLAAALALGLSGCEDKPSGRLAPVSSSLAPARPASEASQKFEVEQKSSQVDFLMAAPIERIHGKAPESASGELNVDLSDITKSNGLIKVDLDKLALYHSRRDDEKGKFGEEDKNENQNKHMRTWFQISDDAPKEMREQNRYVEFKLDKVDSASAKNVLAMKGSERKITATVSGDFRLHGRKVKKTAKLELTFKFDGKMPVSVHVKTAEPVDVSLEAHDIKPRETFEKLASKTLGALGQKVAKTAPVSLEFDAKLAK